MKNLNLFKKCKKKNNQTNKKHVFEQVPGGDSHIYVWDLTFISPFFKPIKINMFLYQILFEKQHLSFGGYELHPMLYKYYVIH